VSVKRRVTLRENMEVYRGDGVSEQRNRRANGNTGETVKSRE